MLKLHPFHDGDERSIPIYTIIKAYDGDGNDTADPPEEIEWMRGVVAAVDESPLRLVHSLFSPSRVCMCRRRI